MLKARMVVGGLVLFVVACVTTKEEGDLLRHDVKNLQGEVAETRESQARKERELDSRLAQADEKLKQMESLQKDLDDRGSRNKADFGAEVSNLQNEVAGLRGALETKEYQLKERELQMGASQTQVKDLEAKVHDMQKRLDDMEAKLKAAPAAAPVAAAPPEPAKPAIPTDRQGLYDYSKKAFDDGKYEVARDGFDKFLKAFPKDKELTDNVHFWSGECHFAEKHYDKAILSYSKVITEFPKSEKADASLFKTGNSFVALGFDDDAKAFYEDLLQKYPKSPLVKDTKTKLEELQKRKKPAPAPAKAAPAPAKAAPAPAKAPAPAPAPAKGKKK